MDLQNFFYKDVRNIEESDSTIDLCDIDSYPYCIVVGSVSNNEFYVYKWNKVKKHKQFVEKFHLIDWESLLSDTTFFNMLKNRIVQLLDCHTSFPEGFEFIEVPKLVLKGELPSTPYPKCIFKLSVNEKFVLREDVFVERKAGSFYFNNGLFIYNKLPQDKNINFSKICGCENCKKNITLQDEDDIDDDDEIDDTDDDVEK